MISLQKIKHEVYHILYTQDDLKIKSWKYYIDDYFISSLIILNVFVIMLESFNYYNNEYTTQFQLFELFSVSIFSFEYILRIWVADLHFPKLGRFASRFRYIFSILGVIDLLAILPYYIPFFYTLSLKEERFLRLFRLFRIFKLAHYSKSLNLVGKVFKDKKRELIITVAATFILIMIVSTIMLELEHEIQPEKFNNIFGAFWWAIETLTTIGYGDVHPMTGWGKFLAAITALLGIGIVAIPTGILSVGFLEELNNNKKRIKNIRQRKMLLKKTGRKSKKKYVLNRIGK